MSMITRSHTPQTQKAIGITRGIQKLGDIFGAQYLYKTPKHQILRSNQDINNLLYCELPGFARPCPKVPRHGFVESRTVHTKTQLKELLKAVLKADPKGELLLGPHISNVKCNAVYVSSGLLSIGPKNDGATGGKHSFSIPVAPLKYSRGFLKEMLIDTGDAVYLEAVFNKYPGCWVTQVRGGPRLEDTGRDYIPFNTKVERVIVPSKDLLKWEQEAQSLKPGTVVFGNGYTLASHAAIHCVLNRVPFISSRKPVVGEMLKATEDHVNKLTRQGFQKGVSYALRMSKRDEFSAYFRYCLSVLHNWAYLRTHPQADQMLGVAVTLLVKLCASLSFGEYRHNTSTLRGMDRDDIYSMVLASGAKYLNQLPTICKGFYTQEWSEGFGGLPWSSCTYYSSLIWNSIIKMYNRRTKVLSEEEITHLVGQINRTVNMVHNNSWWFDKISSQHEMDLAANYPGFSAFLVADVFYKTTKGIESTKRVKKHLTAMKKVETPFVLNTDGKLICAYMRPKESAHNDKCFLCGYYDCWCKKKQTDTSASIMVWREGIKHDYEKVVNITRREYLALRKRQQDNGKTYLTIIPKVGFKLPTGRVIKCGMKL